jgi:hypothetical protein
VSGREKQLQSYRKSGFVIPVVLILSFLLVSGCGIYTIDEALKAPYNLSIGLDELTFYGDDDEELLDGYNLWYKENFLDTYERCWYNEELNTPTIPKEWGVGDKYTVDMMLLSPLGDESFSDIHDNKGSTFYFAVSAYGTGIAESGKAGFGLWP